MTTAASPRPGFTALAAQTPARLAVGRTGPRPTWRAREPIIIGDAAAADATMEVVPPGFVTRARLVELASRADSRHDCLRDPVRARLLDPRARARLKRCRQRPDIQIVLCDGLAPSAVATHARALLAELLRLLRGHRARLGTPVFVRNGRAQVYREIERALRPRILCLVVGQRPSPATAVALTAHVIPVRSTGGSAAAHTVVRDIPTGKVTARAAARTLADAIGALLGESRRAHTATTRRARPSTRQRR